MRYGKADVLTGVGFAARRGEVLALLGPSGAGKTTTIEILERFRMRSAGQVSVRGTDPAHGGEAWRATVGVVLQAWRDDALIRVALFPTAPSTELRVELGTAILPATDSILALALLYLFPILAQTIADPRWQRLLQQIGPMSAGLAVQATADLPNLPLSPWAGLGVTAAWAAAALLTGSLLLHVRDV
jgi:hypothetical protein